MFSNAYRDEIKQYFDRQMNMLDDRKKELEKKEAALPDADKNLYRFSAGLLGRKIQEIKDVMAQCSRDEAEALQFMYSAMPLSDLLDYPAALFMAFARHGVFLWKEGPFAGRVPEKIFTNYVLHYRVHNEDITDTRSFFYNRIKERIAGKNMYDAAVETNYWCAEKATYQNTYMRTQNPVTMYGTAMGRCGEEAPFAVTALRSLGIPARGVAAPWWAHCDDNHAWVEAWCDGKWHFMGGCEPEKALDRGWFVGSTARAMLIESKWFGKDAPLEAVAGKSDMASRLNHLPLYADTVQLTVRVKDEKGHPVPNARVDFYVLNYARFGLLASLRTGEEENAENYGVVKFDTGFGDLLVSAYANGCYGESHVSLLKGEEAGPCTIVLREKMDGMEQWRELDFHAPKEVPTEEKGGGEEDTDGQARLEAAADSRQRRISAFYRKEDADRVMARFSEEDRKTVEEMLLQARGNMGEIVRFLEWDFTGRVPELEDKYGREHWKIEALNSLKKNDFWDIRAEVLAECSICSSPYADDYPQEVFFDSLLNPGVAHEYLRACRSVLGDIFTEEQKEEFRRDPKVLQQKLEELLNYLPEQEYANLVTLPLGCLTGGYGSKVSESVLCVQMYRALGIPARLRPLDRMIEYYADGGFVPVKVKEQAPGGKLLLKTDGSLSLEDGKHYSLSKFENGRIMPLFLRALKEEKSGEGREVDLEQGLYRFVTTNRLSGGDQLVRVYDFRIEERETKELTFGIRDISVESLLDRMPVDDLSLCTAEGEKKMLSQLGGGKRILLLWLELAKEPTEHILNEMVEKRERFAELTAPIYFVVSKGIDDEKDVTLKKAREALPHVQLLFDDFGESYEKLSRQVKRVPGKLPLALVLQDGKECLFSGSGYNVGMADMLLRILAD